MSKGLLVLSLIGALTMAPAPLLAAETNTPLTEADLTLRPGDTITWSPKSVHILRFGGTVKHKGADLALTPFADVEKVLDTTPKLTVDGNGVAKTSATEKVTATVKANAHTSGVAEFFFTCGFSNTHANEMVTVSFKIAAPDARVPRRDIAITTTNDPPLHRWLLTTAGGEKSLTRP